MLDIKFIRENPEKVKRACENRGVSCKVDRILELDGKRRILLQEIEALRAQQNKLGKEQISQAQALKQQIKERAPVLENVQKEVDELVLNIPNIPLDSVPVGKDERENVVLYEKGKKRNFDFPAKDYMELAEALDVIDVKRAAKVSGSRFGYLKGDLALMEFALVELTMRTASKERFIPIVPPVLVKQESMRAMGYIDTPEDLAERYFFEKDKLFLVGTSEQSVGPMHQDEVFEEKDLPKRYVAFSTCFREEAGSYGKDTKGILRVHQFDKVEFVSFAHPKKSQEEHKFLLSRQEKLWQELEIPYRVVQLCTGDLARPSAQTYDIEAWLPGQGTYREVSSTSTTTDFQSRRLNVRFRKKNGPPARSAEARRAGEAGGIEFVHMLNGTGFAIGRTLIAILENYQQKDESVKIPTILQKYMGKKEIKR